jgi:predicted acylesterase/phospholipase RssA
LQRAIRAALSDDLIARIAARFEAGNDLILGATNLDTGRFDLLDIGRVAASDRYSTADKRTCLTEAILATSAIPALFPPRRIGTDLYTDAGVRQAVFLAGLRDGLARAERALGVDIRVNVYLIVNSDLRVRQGPVATGLLGVAGRSFELIADEGLRVSLRETVVLARRSGWRLRAVVAPEIGTGKCLDCDALFSPEVTEALFRAGHAMATAERIGWIDGRALMARIAAY